MTQMQISGPGGGQKQPEDGWSAKGFKRFGMVCVLILAGGFGGWAATAELAGAVIAMGQLRVEANRQVVQHPDGGVVAEILARDGDTVTAGQVLIRLDEVALRSELAAQESQYYEILARLGRLDAVQVGAREVTFDRELLDAADADPEIQRLIDGQLALFMARNESMAKELLIMDQQKQQAREQITGTQAEIQSLVIQAEKIAQEAKGARELLRKKLIREPQVLALEREAARLEGDRGRLAQQVPQFQSQISEIELQQLRMVDTMREEAIGESRELGFRRLELRERLVALRQQMTRLEIKAPRPGTVIESTIFTIGAVVRPAEPIMYVVPTDTGLVVDARFEPTDVDNVTIGQETVLRFSALNTRTTPELSGHVIKRSNDTIMDEQSGLSYYRVEVAIDDGELPKLGDQTLVAGMPVEAYIQTGKRTPLEYLVKPISDYFAGALRSN